MPSMTEAIAHTARLGARITPNLHALLKRAAAIEGRTVTDFVVAAARNAAERTIKRTEIIRLSAEDQQRFAKLLLDPPVPTPAMRRAFEHHRALFGDE